MAIIAVLSVTSILVLSTSLEKSREATDIANLRNAKAAATAKYLEDDENAGTYVYDASRGIILPMMPFVLSGDSIDTYGKGTAKSGGNETFKLYDDSDSAVYYESNTDAADKVIVVNITPGGEISLDWSRLEDVEASATHLAGVATGGQSTFDPEAVTSCPACGEELGNHYVLGGNPISCEWCATYMFYECPLCHQTARWIADGDNGKCEGCNVIFSQCPDCYEWGSYAGGHCYSCGYEEPVFSECPECGEMHFNGYFCENCNYGYDEGEDDGGEDDAEDTSCPYCDEPGYYRHCSSCDFEGKYCPYCGTFAGNTDETYGGSVCFGCGAEYSLMDLYVGGNKCLDVCFAYFNAEESYARAFQSDGGYVYDIQLVEKYEDDGIKRIYCIRWDGVYLWSPVITTSYDVDDYPYIDLRGSAVDGKLYFTEHDEGYPTLSDIH